MEVRQIRLLGRSLPMTLLELRTDDGLVGIGGGDVPMTVARAVIEHSPSKLGDIVIGRDPRDVITIWRDLFRASLGQGGIIVNVMAALDMALWDLAGKAQGLPIYKLLGGAVQDRITPYASATAFDLTHGLRQPLKFKSTDRLLAEVHARIAEGFTVLKFGWGNHFAAEDEQRIAALRETVGPNRRLMIDLGGPDYFSPGLTSKGITQIAKMLERHDIFFLEEPLPPYDADGHAALTRATEIRIASGEMLCHEYEFDRFIDQHAVDVIQPDAYRIGITQTANVARKADAAGILCVPHSPWSALALAAHVNVLATVATGAMVEYPSPSLYHDTIRHGELVRINTEQLIEHPLRQRDGFISLPTRPGLGVGGFNYEAIERADALAAEGFERS